MSTLSTGVHMSLLFGMDERGMGLVNNTGGASAVEYNML